MTIIEKEALFFSGLIEKYDIRNVIVYSRKSRNVDDIDVLSKHRESLNEVIDYFDFKVGEERWFEEVDSSELRDRKEFQNLIKYLHDHHQSIDALLVHDIDRLGRNWFTSELYGWLEHYGILILSVADDMIYDLNNDESNSYFRIKDLIANFEIRKYKARTRLAQHTAFKNGEWMGGKPLFPYTFDSETKGLKFTEEDKKIYYKVVDMFLSGSSYDAIADWLSYEAKIPTFTGGARWSGKPVKSMLTSEQHLGLLVKKGKGNHKKKNYKRFEESQWEISKGKWEAIKSEELHNKISKEVMKRSMLGRKSKNQIHSLSGLMVCGICGRNMTIFKNDNGDLCTRACEDKTNKIKCGNKGGKVGLIEKCSIEMLERLLEELEKHETGSSVIFQIEERKKKIERNKEEIADKQDDSKEMKKAIINPKKYGLTEMDVEETIEERNELLKQIEKLQMQNQIFETEIQELEMQKNKTNKEVIEEAIEQLKTTDSPSTKNKKYKHFIKAIHWIKTDSELKFTFEMY